ncbi:MAG: MgtC/SapB transporter [Parcubacteria group bacterium GW2011_GWA1_47_8]|nr:MAG: MgtC/SapB transporter [Parcubacteria group bacterium GW2011_GWA1_47_8]KKW07220.1 MAG: MgtC/SapB transporter [Parcubacteria group bacterium GW2011_GWA2_49_16]
MEFIDAHTTDIILKLVLALLLGMLIGLERSIAGKTAGMRTYGLVALGAALFSIVGILASGGYESAVALTNSTRFASQIITGIGFIGAGLVIFKQARVSGVTTAAGIWIAAGVGMAVGYGFYTLAIAATVLSLFSLTILWFVENRLTKFVRSSVFPGQQNDTLHKELDDRED